MFVELSNPNNDPQVIFESQIVYILFMLGSSLIGSFLIYYFDPISVIIVCFISICFLLLFASFKFLIHQFENMRFFGLIIQAGLIPDIYIFQILSTCFSIVIYDIFQIISLCNVPTQYRNIFMGVCFAFSRISFYIASLGIYINEDNYYILMLTTSFFGAMIFMTLDIKSSEDFMLREVAEIETSNKVSETVGKGLKLNFSKKGVLGKVPIYKNIKKNL